MFGDLLFKRCHPGVRIVKEWFRKRARALWSDFETKDNSKKQYFWW
jgi:hypothetical protein